MSDLKTRYSAASTKGKRPGELITALDLGASKIACLLAKHAPHTEARFELAGQGEQSSRGLKGGVVIDMEGLERSILLAVEDAERQAKQRTSKVRLAVSGPYLKSRILKHEIDMAGREISQKDVIKLMREALSLANDDSQHMLHAFPVSYAIDGNDGVRDPRGMYADKLGVRLHLVQMPMPIYRNLVICVSRADLEVEGLFSSGYGSANAVLTDDERDDGAICIDLGGGSTSINVFLNGTLAFQDVISVGGQHVTSDLAHGIGSTFPAAERVKTLHGSVLPTKASGPEFVEVPVIGDDGRLQASRMSKAELTKFILPRVEEIFEFTSKSLSASGLGGRLPRRVVLTGGGSQLPGVREVASRVLSMQVRLGKPLNAEQLGEICQRATFSTASGLLTIDHAGQVSGAGKAYKSNHSSTPEGGLMGRAFDWLRDNL